MIKHCLAGLSFRRFAPLALVIGIICLPSGSAWAMGDSYPVTGGNVEADFAGIVAECVRVGAGLAAIYLTGNFLFAALQALADTAGGRAATLADAQERIMPAVICFTVAVSANTLGNEIKQIVASGATNADGALTIWRALGSFVAASLLGCLGAYLITMFILNGLSAMWAVANGNPQAIYHASTRLVLMLVLGLLAFLSIPLARALIESMPPL